MNRETKKTEKSKTERKKKTLIYYYYIAKNKTIIRFKQSIVLYFSYSFE